MFILLWGFFFFNPFAVYLSAVYFLVRAIYASNPLVYRHAACGGGFVDIVAAVSRSCSGRGCCGERRCWERVHNPPS